MILSLNSELLHHKLDDFDFYNAPTDPIQLAKDLVETMLANKGAGLAANQVGLPYRAFVIASNPVIAVFNPYILEHSSTETVLEEGCLSFPGMFIKIKRPDGVKVRYTQPNGNVVTESYRGLTARIFLHEMDHLDGIVFEQRANFYQVAMAKKRLERAKLKSARGRR